MTVTVSNWGNRVNSRQCVLNFITADVDEASTIVATVPWTSPPLDPDIAKAFATCVQNAKGVVTLNP